MSAKPIIDIDIVAETLDGLTRFKERLGELGYVHVGDLGIADRKAFKQKGEPLHPHNLYLVRRDSAAYRNHVLLKKHLTGNPGSFKRYNDLKLSLADSAFDVDEYCRSKTTLILELLEAEGVPRSELDQIRDENPS
ncbi:GrpB family protein [Candidatus Bathyarchaeota archaeon]|nr:GrpB family protein [Candidatus Bathyarchaeota archaeon]